MQIEQRITLFRVKQLCGLATFPDLLAFEETIAALQSYRDHLLREAGPRGEYRARPMPRADGKFGKCGLTTAPKFSNS